MCQALFQALGTHQKKTLALLELTFETACGTGSGGEVGEGEVGTSRRAGFLPVALKVSCC